MPAPRCIFLTVPHPDPPVCEVDPPKPSAVAAVATGHTLRGDLDTIVAKALRKSASERYSTVAEVAGELRAWREGRPIAAAPPEIPHETIVTRTVYSNDTLPPSIYTGSPTCFASETQEAFFIVPHATAPGNPQHVFWASDACTTPFVVIVNCTTDQDDVFAAAFETP